MRNSTFAIAVDVEALNITLSQAIVPMFWGTIALLVAAPIATAAGGWVAEKITGGGSKKKKVSSRYD